MSDLIGSMRSAGTLNGSLVALRGLKGDKGDTGDMPDFSIGTVTTVDSDEDASVTITGTQEEPQINFEIPRGAIPNFGIGTVTTGNAGSSASASITGTTAEPRLNLTIPRGDKGQKGDVGSTPNITIGSVITGAEGTSVIVTNTGSVANPVFNFTIPKGDTGATGNGIESIELTSVEDPVKTYTITFTNGDTTTFEVTDGDVTEDTLNATITEALQRVLPKETVSGTVASFEDGADGVPMEKVEVSLSPTQSGTGTPSPSNVRPIYGVGGVIVYDSPTEDEEDAETYTQEFDVSLTPTSKDTDPYLFKAVGDIYGDRLEEELVGGSVVWNELLYNGKGDSIQNWNGIRCSLATDGTAITATTDGTGFWSCVRTIVESPINHKYIIAFDLKASSTGLKISGSLSGNSINNNTFISNKSVGSANTWERIAIITNATTENVTSFRLAVMQATSENTISFKNVNVVDLTAMFGSTIADYVYSLEQATAGSGIAWLKSYGFFTKPYYEYDAGTLKSVNPTAHKMVGKNRLQPSTLTSKGGTGITYSIDDDGVITLTGTPNATQFIGYSFSLRAGNYLVNGCPTGGGTSAYQAQIRQNSLDGTALATDTGSGIHLNITEDRTLYYSIRIASGVSVSGLKFYPMISYNTMTDATFEPYEEHTYDIVPTTLRGKFVLDNGELKCEGDTLTYNKHTEAWEEVDLGNFTWQKYSGTANVFVSNSYSSGKKVGNFNLLCSKYPTSSDASVSSMPDGVIKGHGTTGNIYIKDSAFATQWTNDDMASFKSAMSGVKLILEKATPTVTTGEYFEQIQEVSKYGTLEYITNNDVPVGHNTTYMTRDVFGGTLDLVSGLLTVTHTYDYNYDGGDINEPWVSDRNQYVSGTKPTTGASVCYPLDEPLTYQLTPKQIQTLVGTNNVWSEQGDVVVIYFADPSLYIEKKLKELKDEILNTES